MLVSRLLSANVTLQSLVSLNCTYITATNSRPFRFDNHIILIAELWNRTVFVLYASWLLKNERLVLVRLSDFLFPYSLLLIWIVTKELFIRS
jgi:hypothetical protein